MKNGVIIKGIKIIILFLLWEKFVFSQSPTDISYKANQLQKPARIMINDMRINDDSGKTDQRKPAIAMNKYGYILLCWEDNREGNSDIYVQQFNAKGLLVKTNFKINDDTGNSEQTNPDAAIDNRGHFIVVWEDDRNGNADIYGQLFRVNGNPISQNFKVNDDETGEIQATPSVAMDRDGDFVVCWSDERKGSSSDVYAQRYNFLGETIGPNFIVNSDTSWFQTNPAIAIHGNGSFVITWNDARDSGIFEIYAQQFDTSGATQGSNFKVSSHPGPSTGTRSPRVSIQKNGDFMICWSFSLIGGSPNIYGRLYDENGISIKDLFVVNETDVIYDNEKPVVSAASGGGYSVAWHTYRSKTWDIYVRNLNAAGNPVGESIRINDRRRDQQFPCLGTDDRGITIYAWEDDRDTDWNIYAIWSGPHIPQNITVGNGFDGLVPITWDPVFGDEENRTYKIYRSTISGGFYERVATINTSSRPLPKLMMDWIDTTVTNGTKYYYVIESDISESDGYSEEVNVTPSSKGHEILSKWAYAKPAIDGEIGGSEWYDAETIDISCPDVPLPVILYIKHDENYLYLAVDDQNDEMVDPQNILGILFDEDHNGEWDTGSPSNEGRIDINNSSAIFTGFWGNYPNSLGVDVPRPASGVEWNISTASGNVQYEVSIDLNSSPLNAGLRSKMGFAVWISNPGNFYPAHYGNSGEWPYGALWEAALPLGNLVLTIPVVVDSYNNWPMYSQSKEQTSWAKEEIELFPPFDYSFTYPVVVPETISFFDQILYVSAFDTASGPNRVYAFDFESRDQLWRFDVPGTDGFHQVVCTPAVNDSLVFCGGRYGSGLYALDRFTGDQKWFKSMGCNHPVLDGIRIYVLSDSLYCLEIGNGGSLWSYPISSEGVPAVDDSNVYTYSDSIIHAFDKITGSVEWEVDNIGHHSLTLDEEFLYTNRMIDSTGYIDARRKNNGSIYWSYQISDGWFIAPYTIPNAMAASDSFLCFPSWNMAGTQMRLVTIDKFTGTYLWYHTFEDSVVVFPPSIANGIVYVVGYKSTSSLWGFNIRTGDSLFYDNSERYIPMSIIARATLFVPTFNGVKAFSNLPVSVESTVQSSLPRECKLAQNYPNPFNPETTIRFWVEKPSNVLLKVYDLLGREVYELVNDKYLPGKYEVKFNATGLSSGIYFYRIQIGDFRTVRKMVVLE